MDQEWINGAWTIIAACEAVPDDAIAQAVARWVRQSFDPCPDSPLAARMRGLLSDYGLAILDDDIVRQRAAAQALRLAIAGALVPGSESKH